jgi:hypothetical protein
VVYEDEQGVASAEAEKYVMTIRAKVEWLTGQVHFQVYPGCFASGKAEPVC